VAEKKILIKMLADKQWLIILAGQIKEEKKERFKYSTYSTVLYLLLVSVDQRERNGV
jgi:hypothetical protein